MQMRSETTERVRIGSSDLCKLLQISELLNLEAVFNTISVCRMVYAERPKAVWIACNSNI